MPDPFARSQAPSFVAPVTPPGREAEVTFISGVTADATVAATSFGAWTRPSIPPQYNPYYSYTTKWGDPTLQLGGTPAVVTYQFATYESEAANWSPAEKGAWGAALALWSAEVAITFKLAEGGPADLTFYKQPFPGFPDPTAGTFQAYASERPSAAPVSNAPIRPGPAV